MEPSIRLASLALMTISSLLWRSADAAPPRVISMQPDHGDINVDPAITHIRVTFDQDMSPNGRSICGGGSTFPELSGQPVWESPRVIAIPVKLKPGAVYSMSMNCPAGQNFRSASGEPAESSPLSFRTAPDGVAPAPARVLTPEENLAAIDAAREAVNDAYSYRDRVVKDWDALFESHRAALEASPSPAAFAREAGRMLAASQDPHVRLVVNDASFGSVHRSFTPNFDGQKIGPTVPGLRRLNDIVLAGVIEPESTAPIGYILIASWPGDPELLRHAHEELTAMISRGFSRIIIDVRPNGGGDELTARAFASRFTQGRAVYSRNRIRDAASPNGWTRPFERAVQPFAEESIDNPKAAALGPADANPLFRGRIAVLQGPSCLSSNESFLLMMRHGAAAMLFGAPSGGSSGNPKPHDLGNGVTLLLPSWEDMEPDGSVIEGRGIEPHEAATFDPRAQRDTVIEAAVRWLKDH